MAPDGPSSASSVSVGDVLRGLWARRGVFFLVWVLVASAVGVVLVVRGPLYESWTRIYAVNERDGLLSLLGSDGFQADLKDTLGPVEISYSLGPSEIPIEERHMVVMRFVGSSPGVQDVASDALDLLETYQSHLRALTWAKNWPAYYEAAGHDAQQARQELQALVDGMEYYRILDAPTEPSRQDGGFARDVALDLAFSTLVATLVTVAVQRRWPR